MCGIIGFNWNDTRLARKMCDIISHRGPDDSGIYADNLISLGHRRLSIIDLSKKGKQPMFNENKSIAIVFNGEIWNFKELKAELEQKNHKFKSNSDTEVIIHGYEEYGTEILAKLEGMFAFAIYDKKAKTLILARDKVGKKPLYYYQNQKDNKFIFASEIKAILLEKNVKREINHQALSDFLSMRHPSRNETMFKGINRIPPASYLVLKDNQVKILPYWHFPQFTKTNQPSESKLNSLIEKSIEKRLMSDVPIGVFLSGGLDSSAIVAYLSKLKSKLNLKDKIKTFSIGFNDPTDELKYAKIIAKKFGTEHKEIISDKNILKLLPEVIYHMDEPLADPASAPTYLLAKEVSKYVKVVIAGDGGDEVFGGYQAINSIDYIKYVDAIPKPLRKAILSPILNILSNYFKYPRKQMLKLASEIAEAENPREMYKKLEYLPFEKADKSIILNKDIRENINLSTFFDEAVDNNKNLKNAANEYYFKDWVPNNLLLKADKMSMAHGLELRTPFLDADLINYSAGLDNKYKQKRYLFRKVVSKLLPKVIMKKKKQGFTLPISNWFTDQKFQEKIKPYLENLKTRNLFNEEELNRIINHPTAFKNDHRLWVLLNLEIWCKIFLDEVDYKKIKI